jgi:hypothetical protein
VNRIRLYNMIHCRDQPFSYPEQDNDIQDSSVEEAFARLQSAGKLMDMLENDSPEWEEVDQAIHEHVQLLNKLQNLLNPLMGRRKTLSLS